MSTRKQSVGVFWDYGAQLPESCFVFIVIKHISETCPANSTKAQDIELYCGILHEYASALGEVIFQRVYLGPATFQGEIWHALHNIGAGPVHVDKEDAAMMSSAYLFTLNNPYHWADIIWGGSGRHVIHCTFQQCSSAGYCVCDE